MRLMRMRRKNPSLKRIRESEPMSESNLNIPLGVLTLLPEGPTPWERIPSTGNEVLQGKGVMLHIREEA